MNIISQLWGYCKLYYKLNSLYTEYRENETVDTERGHHLINLIESQVIECGAICIKFCQWILPILDNIYIKDEDKPFWFVSLETLYEDCPIPSIEYSKEVYMNEFNEDFDDDYIIVDVIGSGSIGQVYKIRNKHNDKEFAFKIIHPDVKKQLSLFKKVLNVVLYCSCIRKKLYDLVPVDYIQFINNFEEQINMIKESNNLLRMSYNYRNNSSVIIPQLIKCSESCMIMSYEEGVVMDKMDLSEYQRTKIISLLYGFISENQLFHDIMHNDIHKANWKVRKLDGDRYSIVIYDFGYCYKKQVKDRPIIHMMTDMFECTDEHSHSDYIDKYIPLIQYFCNDDSEAFKQSMRQYIPTIIVCNPNEMLSVVINVCRGTGSILDACAIQILIVGIQCYKYLKEANINNGNNLKNDAYRVYREKYLDLINLYNTYDCFHEYRDYMKNKLCTLDLDVNELFDTIKDNETVTDELTKLLKFD